MEGKGEKGSDIESVKRINPDGFLWTANVNLVLYAFSFKVIKGK